LNQIHRGQFKSFYIMGLEIFMATGCIHYCGLVRGPHGENSHKWYT